MKEKYEIYLLECPECRTVFEISEKDIGKPPFIVNCPECGAEIDTDFGLIDVYIEKEV